MNSTFQYKCATGQGTLFMSVINQATGETVWQREYPSYYEDEGTGELLPDATPIDMGLMSSTADIAGLTEMLRSSGVIGKDDTIEKYTEPEPDPVVEKKQHGGEIENIRTGFLELNKKIAKEKGFRTEGDYIFLYHGTSPANFKKILKSGMFKSGTWFATDYDTSRRFAMNAISRGEPIVDTVLVYMGSVTFNGYFTSQEDLYFKDGRYKPEGIKMREGGTVEKVISQGNIPSTNLIAVKPGDNFIMETYRRIPDQEGFEYVYEKFGAVTGVDGDGGFTGEIESPYGGKKTEIHYSKSDLEKPIKGNFAYKLFVLEFMKDGGEIEMPEHFYLAVWTSRMHGGDDDDPISEQTYFSPMLSEYFDGSVENAVKEAHRKFQKAGDAYNIAFIGIRRDHDTVATVYPDGSKQYAKGGKVKPSIFDSVTPEIKSRRAELFEKKYGVHPIKLWEKAKETELYDLQQEIDHASHTLELKEKPDKDELLLALIEIGYQVKNRKSDYIQDVSDFEIDVPPIVKALPKQTTPLESFQTIVTKDNLRPAMTGVYYDVTNKRMVATNAHILAMLPAKLTGENRVMDIKTNKPLSLEEHVKFPNYEVVLPTGNIFHFKNIHVATLYYKLYALVKAKKLFYEHSETYILVHIPTPFGPYFCTPDFLYDVILFFIRNGVTTVDFELSPFAKEGQIQTGMYVRSSTDKNIETLVMPVMGSMENMLYDTLELPKGQLAENAEKKLVDSDYHKKELAKAKKANDDFGIEYHTKLLSEENARIVAVKQKIKELRTEDFARGGKIKNGDTIKTKSGAEYYINEVPDEVKKNLKSEYDKTRNGVNIFFRKNIQYPSEVLAQLRFWFEKIKQPTESEVRRAMLLIIDDDYGLKAGGESASDNQYSSSLKWMQANPKTGEDYEPVIVKKHSSNFKDVLITFPDIEELIEATMTPEEIADEKIDDIKSYISMWVRGEITNRIGYSNGDRPFTKAEKENILKWMSDRDTGHDVVRQVDNFISRIEHDIEPFKKGENAIVGDDMVTPNAQKTEAHIAHSEKKIDAARHLKTAYGQYGETSKFDEGGEIDPVGPIADDQYAKGGETSNHTEQSAKLEKKWRDELKKNGVSATSRKYQQEFFNFNKKHFPVKIEHVTGVDYLSKKPYDYGQINFSKVSGWADRDQFYDVVKGQYVPNVDGKKIGIRFSSGGGSAFYDFNYSHENAEFVKQILEDAGYKVEIENEMADGGPVRKSLFTDEYGKDIVYDKDGYLIAVNDLNNATYITLWHNKKKVGDLTLGQSRESETKGYLQIQNVEILPKHRGQGLGKKMYEIALQYSDPRTKGLASEYSQRSNRNQVPKILKSLGGKELDSGNVLVDRMKDGGVVAFDHYKKIYKGDGSPLYPFDLRMEFPEIFYSEPTEENISELQSWLNDNKMKYVHVFHGTPAGNKEKILQKGILPTSATRRNSYQSGSGYVYVSVFPTMSKTFADMASSYDPDKNTVFEITSLIKSLLPDHDQLNNARASGKEIGNSLAHSLVVGHGARIKGKVDTNQLRIIDAEDANYFAAGGKLSKEKIKEKVEEHLTEKQKKKQFKDVGTRVAGSKKEARAYTMITMKDLPEIEENDVVAYKLVTKDKVYPEINVAEQRAAGISSGAVFLKVKIREACGQRPPNEKTKRASFIRFINELTTRTKDLKTVTEMRPYMDSLKDLQTEEVIGYFIDTTFFDATDKVKAEIREGIKKAFPYAGNYVITKKLMEEIFSKRFANFLFLQSDAARQTYTEAVGYDSISEEQSKTLIDKYVDQKQKYIDANREKLEKYTAATEDELKILFREWTGMDRFRKDMVGFREAALKYYQKRIDTGNKEKETIPENLKPREDNWSWFETSKDRKKVEASGEIQINSGTPLSYIKRTGGLVISDEYVNQAKSTDTGSNPITRDFGFVSVQYGNSIKNTESREQVKHFLGAMADLAEILDIDIKALNGIGGLSVAFASRGSGKASAHYERGHTIINITNKKGDGFIAHEFGHYFDNALTIFPNRNDKMQYASHILKPFKKGYPAPPPLVENEKVSKAARDLMMFIYNGDTSVTPKVLELFFATELETVPRYLNSKTRQYEEVKLLDTIEETLQYLADNSKLGSITGYEHPGLQSHVFGYIIRHFDLEEYEVPLKTKNSAYAYYASRMRSKYWIEPEELFARAFETYIFDKLDSKGRMNNYLAGAEFDKKVPLMYGGWTYIFPFGDERKHMFKLFDNLVETVKTEFNLSTFKPFTDKRQDEYIVFDENSDKEKVEAEVVEETEMAEGGLVDKSFYVRDTLVDKDYINSLTPGKRSEILELVKEFNALGYIDARTELGPDQSRRMSEKQREKFSDTASKAFRIEGKIRQLLKPEEQVKKEQSAETKKSLESKKLQLTRQISDLETIFPHRINSPRDNKYKKTHALAKKQLDDVERDLKEGNFAKGGNVSALPDDGPGPLANFLAEGGFVKKKIGIIKYDNVIKDSHGHWYTVKQGDKIFIDDIENYSGQHGAEEVEGVSENGGFIRVWKKIVKIRNAKKGEEPKKFEKGGTLTPAEKKVLKRRWESKREAISTMGDNIDRLKRRVRQDLESENEKERLTALIVRIMMTTSERVGNEDSAVNGHFGITDFRHKHVKVDGDRVFLDYTGKSGVDHEKEFSDPKAASLLKALLEQNKDYIFVTSSGFKIRADRVNRYLKDFNVTSKDIRGFNSNRMMVMKLRQIGKVKEEKERKTIFNATLRKIAEKIGHTPATLRKHYLLPEIESNFYDHGTVGKINIE